MSKVGYETGFQRMIGRLLETTTMALVTVMAVVSTMRLLGILS